MYTVLYRTLVLPFYVRNAGTFLVVVLLAFGFMRPMDHEALITAALGSPALLTGVILLWLVYTLRTVGFVRKALAAPDHLFLQTFRLVPVRIRWSLWLLLVAQLLGPVGGYAVWMLARAVHYQAWGSFAVILLTMAGLLVVGAAGADHRLRHHPADSLRLPTLSVRLPYGLFFPAYWLRHEPLSLLLTKLLSGLLLVGVCRLYPTDDYDERLLLIGLMLALITHSQVARQLSTFEHRYLILLPNMPFTWLDRLRRYTLIYGLIWLPDWLILFKNRPATVGVYYMVWLGLTGWGWLLLMHGLAYGREVSPERWQTAVFWTFILGLLAIMFSVPVGVWLAIGWLGAAGISFSSAYRPGSV